MGLLKSSIEDEKDSMILQVRNKIELNFLKRV